MIFKKLSTFKKLLLATVVISFLSSCTPQLPNNKGNGEKPRPSNEPTTQIPDKPVNQPFPSQGQLKDLPSFVTDFLQQQDLKVNKTFNTGFERIDEFSKFYIVPQNYQNASSHDLSHEKVVSGKKAHKAWVYKNYSGKRVGNHNHRAYPTFQLKKTDVGIIKTKALIEFHVLADVELENKKDKDWLSLATLTSYSDIHWFRSYLVNIDKDYRLHLMHVPHQGAQKADIANNKNVVLPRGQWAKITILIDYENQNRFQSPFIAVWQNGVLASASRFNDRVQPSLIPRKKYPPCLKKWKGSATSEAEKLCKLSYENGLAQLHFGLYAPPKVSKGVVFNDNLSISSVVQSK